MHNPDADCVKWHELRERQRTVGLNPAEQAELDKLTDTLIDRRQKGTLSSKDMQDSGLSKSEIDEIDRKAKDTGADKDGSGSSPSAPRIVNVPPQKRTHILDGDRSGGGHGPGRGKPGKSEFPSGMTDDEVIEAIVDVASDPKSATSPGRNGRTIVRGHRNGLDIEVVVEPDGTIVTAYPTNVPRNPRR